MEIKYSKTAVKALAQMDRGRKQRIRQAVHGLTEQPPIGDIKPLHGYPDERRRLRVGKYRVLYRYGDNAGTLYIIDIDTRGDIYK